MATPIRSGLNEERLSELFDLYYSSLCSFCFRHTANWPLAEDLASAVFLEAWHKRGRVQLAESEAKPWLFGVALNMVRNQRRSQRRFHAALARVPQNEIEPDFSERLMVDAQTQQQAEVVRTLFKQLSRKHQEVISLCDWSELSYEEAAATLNVPVGTVRSRLARARQQLNQSLLNSSIAAELPTKKEANGV